MYRHVCLSAITFSNLAPSRVKQQLMSQKEVFKERLFSFVYGLYGQLGAVTKFLARLVRSFVSMS